MAQVSGPKRPKPEEEMIALVVFACLASQPDTCSQNVVAWSDQPAALTCSAEQPALLAAWSAALVRWLIISRSCSAIAASR